MDQLLQCCDCAADFLFSEGEQAFFEARGFALPKRCKGCRDALKARREAGTPNYRATNPPWMEGFPRAR